jgi:2-polyprenyl-3-methyl-5-hydroxy-6-metoxy-1,4-benzoquinol methylase
MRELLLGCGRSRAKRMALGELTWSELTTIDYYPECQPDIVWDLNDTPWPFDDNTFDEVHAYEVLEHLGRQGDFIAFFAHFTEIWRILKPGGHLFATTPALTSPWLWGDPGHTRTISLESLTFLNQDEYARQVEVMTEYRHVYRGDLRLVMARTEGDTFAFMLQAHK